MSPEVYRRAGEIFDRACDVETQAELDAFLDAECGGGDSELRKAVEGLLAAERDAPKAFLNKPALDATARILAHNEARKSSVQGAIVGAYRLGSQIGAGGMGAVYEAVDLRLDRPVAVKLLPPLFQADPDRVQRFEQEARAASLLNHPNIVSIHDAGRDENAGQLYIATELVQGRTLRELAAEGPLDAQTVVDIGIQVASALDAAHSAGIVHRDIKPENIMRRPDGIVKVLDFGLAKLIGRSSDPNRSPARAMADTRPGSIAGTIHYLSPEQVLGRPAGPRSDLFSVGVVLCELSSGLRPFDGATDGAIFDAILHGEPRRSPGMGGLWPVISRLLEKDPDLRFQTAGDLRAALKLLHRDSMTVKALSGSDLAAASGGDLGPRPFLRQTRRWRRILWPAVAAMLGGGLVWILAPPKAGSPSGGDAPTSFERLTADPGEEAFPTLSPDGKQFLYASRASGNWDIYLKRTGGQTAINLTGDHAGADTQPALSHDGSRVAFRSERDGGGIFVMEATGENPRRISSKGFHPAWSPDDRHLVCSESGFDNPSRRSGRFSRLMVFDLDSGKERILENPGDAIQASWSPHGHRIAYWGLVGGSGQRDIFTIAADGSGQPVAVTRDAALDWNPVWSPDGREIFFLSDRGGSMNVWRIPVEEKSGAVAGPARPVTAPALYARHLHLSANGSQFAYVNAEQSMKLFGIDIDSVTGRITGPLTAVGEGSRWIGGFSFSPDGSKIVYDTLGDSREDLWIMNADGSQRRRLTDDPDKDRQPSWSPDGKEIAFYSDRATAVYNVWAIRPDGSGLRRLTNAPAGDGLQDPSWSVDGKRLAVFSEGVPPRWVAAEGSAATGWSQPQAFPGLERLEGNVFLLARHRDGVDRWLVEQRPEGNIYWYDAVAGRAVSFGIPGFQPDWLPPGQRRIVFHRRDRILLYDVATKREQVLYSGLPGDVWDMKLSPDGRRLYFSLTLREGDIWLARFGEKGR